MVAWKTSWRNVNVASIAVSLTRKTLVVDDRKRKTFRTLLANPVLNTFNTSRWALNCYCWIQDKVSTVKTNWNTFLWSLLKEKVVFAFYTISCYCTDITIVQTSNTCRVIFKKPIHTFDTSISITPLTIFRAT